MLATNVPSMHHPWRQIVTTSNIWMGGLGRGGEERCPQIHQYGETRITAGKWRNWQQGHHSTLTEAAGNASKAEDTRQPHRSVQCIPHGAVVMVQISTHNIPYTCQGATVMVWSIHCVLNVCLVQRMCLATYLQQSPLDKQQTGLRTVFPCSQESPVSPMCLF